MFNYERLLSNLDDSTANKRQASSSKSSDQLESSIDKSASSSASSISSSTSKSSSASSSSSYLVVQHRQQTTQAQANCQVHQRRQKQANQPPVDAIQPIQQLTLQLSESRQSRRSENSIGGGQLFALPPVVANSSLVRQRASAKDSLAAATVTTGASLPLMIGNRSKCVVNLLDDPPSASPAKNLHHHSKNQNNSNNCTTTSQFSVNNQQQQYPVKVPPTSANSRQAVVPPSLAVNPTSAATLTVVVATNGPKNTALRAEQRKQNMVSVVRPVVNHQHQSSQQHQHQQHGLPSSGCEPISGHGVDSRPRKLSTTAMAAVDDLISGDDDQPFAGWTDLNSGSKNHQSIIDEFMDLEQRVYHQQTGSIRPSYTSGHLDELLLSNRLDGSLGFGSGPNHRYHQQLRPRTEQELRQDMILFRREEFELNRNIKKQHKFVLLKIEERKRNLQIIQSVWAQKDFKHAIEKLVDLYHQGLVFTCEPDAITSSNKQQQSGDNLTATNRLSNISTTIARGSPHTTTTLSSMNTSLVVDVIGVIILRPKLWSLEICQLILPIIVNDLLLQQPTTRYENYIEVGLKSLKLILTHFSSVIKTTLESQKDSAKLVGVDLSREDRINKCLNCYKFLQEARSIVAKRCSNTNNAPASEHQLTNKLSFLYRDLQQSFNAFQASFEPSQISLFTSNSRRQQQGQQ